MKEVKVESLSRVERNGSIIIIGFMFFIFGFISWINAILIPYFKIAFELTNLRSYLVTFSFYISYFIMSLPASALLNKVGFKRGMMIGFWIMSMGAFLFIPAAFTRTYSLFLMGLFTLGTGLAVLQTAANPYITMLGDPERAAQRISIMGICNKGAGILAPLAFSAVVLKVADAELLRSLPNMSTTLKNEILGEFIARVIYPYAFVALVLFLVGLFIRYSFLPEIATSDNSMENTSMVNKKSILHFPHLVLGALAIFVHVGTQVISIDTIIGYASSMNLTLLEAKAFPAYTLTSAIIGYLFGVVLIPRWINQTKMLQLCTILGLLFSICILFLTQRVDWLQHNVDVSIWFLVGLGAPNALIWAGIWPLALKGLGEYTKKGSALLIMGLSGNAILPLVYGALADSFNARIAYVILTPCYLYLVFYAFCGYKIEKWFRI